MEKPHSPALRLINGLALSYAYRDLDPIRTYVPSKLTRSAIHTWIMASSTIIHATLQSKFYVAHGLSLANAFVLESSKLILGVKFEEDNIFCNHSSCSSQSGFCSSDRAASRTHSRQSSHIILFE